MLQHVPESSKRNVDASAASFQQKNCKGSASVLTSVDNPHFTRSPGRNGQTEGQSARSNRPTRRQLPFREPTQLCEESDICSGAMIPVACIEHSQVRFKERDSDTSQENDHPHQVTKPAAMKLKTAKFTRGDTRKGCHANFVRMANQKGKSSFRFTSKSGCHARQYKNRKWAACKMAQESLLVAGCGADSTREARTVCPSH
jgi:hypothetical protein